jgi:hypothetical protein
VPWQPKPITSHFRRLPWALPVDGNGDILRRRLGTLNREGHVPTGFRKQANSSEQEFQVLVHNFQPPAGPRWRGLDEARICMAKQMTQRHVMA